MRARPHSGFTLVEAIVAAGILAVLLFLAAAFVLLTPRAAKGSVLADMKQLHLATMQMVLDGTTTGDTNSGWPGDTGGTFTN
ncbi:hypothetical protein BH09VER1_BH09VER1_44610 [soil metagenome]